MREPAERRQPRQPKPPRRRWYWLLLGPFVFLLWPPRYNRAAPQLFGFPFFYWYQLGWVILTALVTWFVYRMARDDG